MVNINHFKHFSSANLLDLEGESGFTIHLRVGVSDQYTGRNDQSLIIPFHI